MKILYNESTILERCQDVLSEYMELLNRIGEDVPYEIDELEEEISQYIKMQKSRLDIDNWYNKNDKK
tara:strand:- start:371 stop:571 length:201 start_codon:yes stop_codon:yes gene_type:complete